MTLHLQSLGNLQENSYHLKNFTRKENLMIKLLTIICLPMFLITATATYEDYNNITGIVLIGDSGKDNEGQYQVSLSMLNLCAKEKCDFGMMAGDNVYPGGVMSPNDPILETVFDKYYDPLNIPFLVALGNHDYGLLPNKWKRGKYQLLHGVKNPNFYIPHYYYVKELDYAVVAVLDTNRLMWKKDLKVQGKMIEEALKHAQKANKWFIVLGHHPYLSNGKHGNAGKYEDVSIPYMVSGKYVKRFLDKHVCGKADFYFSGHDHSLQVFEKGSRGCNTHLVVSGSAASATKLLPRNTTKFETRELGFFHVGIGENALSLRAYNSKTELLFVQNYLK
jgi:tartrate-resistant acid phosphatase type 5